MRFELDVGCGIGSSDGFYERSLVDRHTIKVGLDKRFPFAKQAKQLSPDQIFLAADMVNLPFPAESIDALSATHVLEHLDKPEEATVLSEIARVLRTGGSVRIATPSPLHETLMHRIAPEGYHRAQHHKRVITQQDLVSSVEQAGFSVRSARTKKGWLSMKNLTRILLNKFIFKFPMEEETTRIQMEGIIEKLYSSLIKPMVYLADLVFLKAEDPTLTKHRYYKALLPVRIINDMINKILPFENYVIATKKHT
ncbi:MAG: class I SAM-dependent methyltransferase [Parcubacteria group bacterium]|nr:class I SAM-dependent methyltransferase [Parcubacteria group bacterium]